MRALHRRRWKSFMAPATYHVLWGACTVDTEAAMPGCDEASFSRRHGGSHRRIATTILG